MIKSKMIGDQSNEHLIQIAKSVLLSEMPRDIVNTNEVCMGNSQMDFSTVARDLQVDIHLR